LVRTSSIIHNSPYENIYKPPSNILHKHIAPLLIDLRVWDHCWLLTADCSQPHLPVYRTPCPGRRFILCPRLGAEWIGLPRAGRPIYRKMRLQSAVSNQQWSHTRRSINNGSNMFVEYVWRGIVYVFIGRAGVTEYPREISTIPFSWYLLTG